MMYTQVAIIIEDFVQLRAKCGYEGMAIGAREILWRLDNGVGGGKWRVCVFIDHLYHCLVEDFDGNY